jgi:hypothetical protein
MLSHFIHTRGGLSDTLAESSLDTCLLIIEVGPPPQVTRHTKTAQTRVAPTWRRAGAVGLAHFVVHITPQELPSTSLLVPSLCVLRCADTASVEPPPFTPPVHPPAPGSAVPIAAGCHMESEISCFPLNANTTEAWYQVIPRAGITYRLDPV